MTGPQHLVDGLTARGWIVAGTGRGYTRLFWPGITDRAPLFVPTDPSAPDFNDLWRAALADGEAALRSKMKALSNMLLRSDHAHAANAGQLITDVLTGELDPLSGEARL